MSKVMSAVGVIRGFSCGDLSWIDGYGPDVKARGIRQPSFASAVQTAERHTEVLQNLRPDPRFRELGLVVRQSKDYRHIVLPRTHRIQG